MEYNEMTQQKHTEQLTRLEMEVQSLKVIVANFETIKDTLLELRFSNAALVESNKELKISNEKITEALETITLGFQGLAGHVNNLQEIANKNTEFRKQSEKFSAQLRIERMKSKYILIAVVVTGVLTLAGIIIPLCFNN